MFVDSGNLQKVSAALAQIYVFHMVKLSYSALQ